MASSEAMVGAWEEGCRFEAHSTAHDAGDMGTWTPKYLPGFIWPLSVLQDTSVGAAMETHGRFFASIV